MTNLIKRLFDWWNKLFESYGDEAHEMADRLGYRPSRGHVKEVGNGQFIWVEDMAATDMSKETD